MTMARASGLILVREAKHKPGSLWWDTLFGRRAKVLRFDYRERCYRVVIWGRGLWWIPPEYWSPRFQPLNGLQRLALGDDLV